jgi:hypothetical protein
MSPSLNFLKKLSTRWAIGAFALAIGLTQEASAARRYLELNMGTTTLRAMDWLYPGVAGTTSDRGVGGSLGYFANLTPSSGFTQIHLGIRQDYLSAELNNVQYSLTAPVALLRFHILQFYVSGGFSPILLQRNHSARGLAGFQSVNSTYAFVGEGGLMYGINPDLSMGLQAGAWILMQQGFLSSSYSTSISASLRFYIKDAKGGGGSANSPEYTGWRYIGK